MLALVFNIINNIDWPITGRISSEYSHLVWVDSKTFSRHEHVELKLIMRSLHGY